MDKTHNGQETETLFLWIKMINYWASRNEYQEWTKPINNWECQICIGDSKMSTEGNSQKPRTEVFLLKNMKSNDIPETSTENGQNE